MVEKAAINNETLMAVAQGYFKAKTFAGLCSTGPMAGELLSCADMAAYRRENLEAWAADVDLPAALGNHFTPESLEALDVQAIQAKIDDIAEHLGAIDEAICKVSKNGGRTGWHLATGPFYAWGFMTSAMRRKRRIRP